LPFFFLTAVDDFLARKYSTLIGADEYITKPVDLDQLEQALKAKLGLP
jgi:DNA-binding response OmpR family regulator